MADRGDPIAYLVLEEGTPVQTSDGEEIGRVVRVLADDAKDIFDGIVISTGAGERFVDAPEVGSLYERLVELKITAAQARELPAPTANPVVVEPSPDDIAGR